MVRGRAWKSRGWDEEARVAAYSRAATAVGAGADADDCKGAPSIRPPLPARARVRVAAVVTELRQLSRGAAGPALRRGAARRTLARRRARLFRQRDKILDWRLL
eukprot:scaffold1293_cov375-Prasinococcus_capsulatus_cf.AAC.10